MLKVTDLKWFIGVVCANEGTWLLGRSLAVSRYCWHSLMFWTDLSARLIFRHVLNFLSIELPSSSSGVTSVLRKQEEQSRDNELVARFVIFSRRLIVSRFKPGQGSIRAIKLAREMRHRWIARLLFSGHDRCRCTGTQRALPIPM